MTKESTSDHDSSSGTQDDKETSKASLPPAPFSSLFRFSTPFELILQLLGLLCAIGAGAAQPLLTIFFGNLTTSFVKFSQVTSGLDSSIDPEAAASTFRSAANRDILIIVYIGLAQGLATWYFMYVWSVTSERNAKRLREAYLMAVLRQDIFYFDSTGSGEITTRIQTDTHLFQQAISEKFPFAFSFVSSFISSYVVAFIRSWKLALALASILPVILVTGVLMEMFSGKYTGLSRQFVAESGSYAEQILSSIRTVQAFGAQKMLADVYDGFTRKILVNESRGAAVIGIGTGIFFFIIYAGYALGFFFGTKLVLLGEIEVGVVINVLFCILIGSFAVALLPAEIISIANGRAAAAKLFAAIDRTPTIDSLSESGLRPPPESVRGEIKLEGVDFAYPSRPDVTVLEKLSVVFEAGKRTAIIGSSGSGKSTIVSLIERFFDPRSGSICLDGTPLAELNVRWLRAQIGLVSQEPVLFMGTVRENILHGLVGSRFRDLGPEERERRMREACKLANAHDFVEALPDGYETLVGEGGSLLSGGQKQRIAIARAIISDPALLILDEATSALDTRSELVVQNALDRAAEGRTTIIIAHRLSTVQKSDSIVVMNQGRIIEQGSPQQLKVDPTSAFRKLIESQKLHDNDDNQEGPVFSDTKPEYTSQTVLESDPEKGRIEIRKLTTKSKPRNALYLLGRVFSLNKGTLGSYFFATLGGIGSGVVYPAFGIVVAQALSSFELNTGDPTLRQRLQFENDRNALWLFVIAITSGFAAFLERWLFGYTASVLVSRVRASSLRALLRLDVEFFDDKSNSSGALTANLSDTPQKISGIAGNALGAIVQALACVIGALIVGLAFSKKLGAVAIALIPFLICTGYIRLRVVMLKDEKNKAAHSSSAQVACEAASSIRTVAALTLEKNRLAEYSTLLTEPLRTATRVYVWSSGLYALSTAFYYWVIALVFWYGVSLVAKGEYDTKQFFVAMMSITLAAVSAGNVFNWVPDISSASSAAAQVVELLDSRPSIDYDNKSGSLVKDVAGNVKLQSVYFRYPTRPEVPVLNGISINAPAGKFTAIVGASGSGKSTIIQLIERFYDPAAGKILLDDQPISKLNIQAYRGNVALVSQEPTLYAGSIKFNVLVGASETASEVSQQAIEDACREANILDFIQSLPEGFETNVGQGGSQLSGGQKQRLAIARALIRNPKILLLDEATSALDSQSEALVQNALNKAISTGRTTIAIAHRLSTIQNADCIYFIQNGTVLESGTHQELFAKRGAYYEYTLLQQVSA